MWEFIFAITDYFTEITFFQTCIYGPGVEAGHEAKSGAVDKHEEASLLDEVVEYVSGYGFFVFKIFILFLS